MQESQDPQTATQSNSTSPISATSKTCSETDAPLRLTTTIAGPQWNELVDTATRATPVHRYECLETVAEHTNTTLHPVVGFRGECPVGLFPVFEKSVGSLTALLSPAPNSALRSLGPVLLDDQSGGSATDEQETPSFVTAVLACLEDRFAPGYIHLRTTPGFRDHQSFLGAAFDSTPYHASVVDLTPDLGAVLARFTSDTRANIQTVHPDLRIAEVGPEEIDPILDGAAIDVTSEFVTALAEALPEGVFRPYVVRLDGRFLGGVITLEDDETVTRWLGGVGPDVDLSVADRLDWVIMRRAAERGCRRYDLGPEHRPGFDPDSVTFHRLVRTTRTMAIATRLYQWFN